ncbi:MAG: MFS transporter [Rhodospirillaceae bacterium]|jgi:predicted MFS family arabinose efflux permease|nr:MFS transporter [Rhodospirillaceae bacterium]
MAKYSESSGTYAVLFQYHYGWYTLGSTISLFGMWAHKLAIAWLAWQLTGSSFWVGAVTFFELVPSIFMAPYAGVIADRYDRRLIALVSQIFGMLQAFFMGWLMLTGKLTEHADIWWVLWLSFFLGIVWSFNTAARLSMVPNLVEPKYIPPAIAFNSAIYNLARVVGPAMAGFIMARWGVGEAFIFNGITFLGFIVTLIMIRQIRTEEASRGKGGALAQSLEGLTYARRHKGIGPMLILLAAFAVGGKALFELLPEFADHIFGRGTEGLAELTATGGAGALIASVWLAGRGTVTGLTRLVITALLVAALAIFGFVVTDWFPLALASIALLGAAGVIGGTGTQTLMQHAVEGGLRGRVMSLYGLIHRGGPALGAVTMGAMAELMGIQLAVATGGILCIVIWVWMMRRHATTAAALEATGD